MALVDIVLASAVVTGFDFSIPARRGNQFFVILQQIFQPDFSYFGKVVDPLLDTIKMSIIGSFLGATLALPVAVLASTNINRSGVVVWILRILLMIIRTLPTLIIAKFAALVFGLGTFAGTVAIIVFTFGIIAKMMYESIETIDMGAFEATESFGMQKYALPGSSLPSAYTFNLVPHQWIYPTGGRETNNLIDNHVRVAPGATYVLDINPGQASDLGVNVFGLNYYRELGNVGDMVANNGSANFTLNGRRLTKFTAVPTVLYGEGNEPAFRVNNIIIGSATRLKEFNVKGASIGTGTLNLSALTLCETIDVRDTKISQVRVPETSTLTTLRLPSTLTAVSLPSQPMLSAFEIEGVNVLTQVAITGAPLLGATAAHSLIQRLVSADALRDTPTQTVNLRDIDWDGVEARTIRWLLDVGTRGTCMLRGSMQVPTGQMVYYEQVDLLIRRYGDIRSADNPLTVSFPSLPISSSVIGISGRKYVVRSEIVPYTGAGSYVGWWNDLSLKVDSGNNVAVATDDSGASVPDVTWEFMESGAATFVSFPDRYSPHILIAQLAKLRTLTVRMSLRTTDGNVFTVEKKIGLWNRMPEVGDFAWTDGEFDNEDDQSKKLAGTVVMREPLEYDGDGNLRKAVLWVLNTANVTIPDSSDGTSASVPAVDGQSFANSWGLYPSATLGFPNTKENGVYTDPLMAAIAEAVNRSDVFDTPLPNKGTDFYISPSTYQDETNNSPVNGATGMSGTSHTYGTVGDGTGYLQRTQTEGVMDFATKAENEKLLEYADQVLTAVYNYFGISLEELPADRDAIGRPTTLQAMADIRQLIVKKAEQAGATNVARFRELMFNAVRACSLWSPANTSGTGITEASLCDEYKRGKWMLPSQGLLARIFNFYWNSSCTTDDQTCEKTRATSAAAVMANADENVTHEAQLPLFSNIMARSNGRRVINMSNGSNHWSVTENGSNYARGVYFSNGYVNLSNKYNGYVVRAVAAFTYEVSDDAA